MHVILTFETGELKHIRDSMVYRSLCQKPITRAPFQKKKERKGRKGGRRGKQRSRDTRQEDRRRITREKDETGKREKQRPEAKRDKARLNESDGKSESVLASEWRVPRSDSAHSGASF